MAQKTADEIQEVAKQKAEQIIKDAELTARSTVEEINTQILMKQKEIEDLKKQFEVYKAKMESLLISQLEMLKDSNNVLVDNIVFGTGTGKNKKQAEQNAARDAIKKVAK